MIPSDWTPDELEEKSHDLMLAVQMDIIGALERSGFDLCPSIKIAQEATEQAWKIWSGFVVERELARAALIKAEEQIEALQAQVNDLLGDVVRRAKNDQN